MNIDERIDTAAAPTLSVSTAGCSLNLKKLTACDDPRSLLTTLSIASGTSLEVSR